MHANLISSTNAWIPKSDCPRWGINSCTSGTSLWKKFLPLLSLLMQPHPSHLNLPPVLLNQAGDRICLVGHQVRASEILQLQTFCLTIVVQNFINKARFLKQLESLATESDHRSIDSALIYAMLQSFCGINSCTSGTFMVEIPLRNAACNPTLNPGAILPKTTLSCPNCPTELER